MGDLYALDFDGILCDSCAESSLSAYKAAEIRWPNLFPVDAATSSWVLATMHQVRPVVETGYENLLLVRLLLEMKHLRTAQLESVLKDLTIESIWDSWETMKPMLMEAWGERSKDLLVELFGEVRDRWIKEDPLDWVHANRFYPGTVDSLKFSTSPVYIVTTKQARFAALLLREIAGVEFPPERIYGLGSGPKTEVLKQLQEQPEHEGLTLHFVEDRLATLRNVIKDPKLDRWNLYLGTWGYNTEKERASAAAVARIHVLDLPDFCAKLK